MRIGSPIGRIISGFWWVLSGWWRGVGDSADRSRALLGIREVARTAVRVDGLFLHSGGCRGWAVVVESWVVDVGDYADRDRASLGVREVARMADQTVVTDREGIGRRRISWRRSQDCC